MGNKNNIHDNCRRIEGIREETLLVVQILRGAGTENDLARIVNCYYKKQRDGSYKLLFEDDPCK